MADTITRCPKCSTAFRISDTLIKSAKGVVRCGSCLNVFNAKEHLVRGSASPKTQKPTPTQATPTSSTEVNQSTARSMAEVVDDLEQLAKTTEHDQKILEASDSKKQEPILKRPQTLKQPQKLKKPNADNSTLFERPTNQEQEEAEGDNVDDDEAWALELLKDDSDPDIQIRKITPQKTAPNEKSSPTSKKRAVKVEKQPSQGKEPNKNTTAEHKQSNAQASATPSEATQSETTLNEKPTQTPPLSTPEVSESNESSIEPVTLKDTIANLELEPLDVAWQKQSKPLAKRILWPVIACLAFIILIGQVAWLQFYKLNQLEPYRTGYAIACNVFGCDLPILKDLSKIEVSNLLIRSHPSEANTLMVDVILKNTASFKQRFPELRLTFTDLRNNPISTRKLTPKEYLGGELTGRKMMPIKQPIHIGIEIVDPGKQAVSYTMAIEE